MATRVKDDEAPAAPSRLDSRACLLQADLSWLLKQAYYALASEIHAAFGPLGVSPRGYHVLEVALTGELTQSEIADATGLDKTTMVVTMDELEAGGLAERLPSEHDRRARVIGVTEAGRAMVRQAREVAARIQDDVLATLPEAQRTELLRSLRSLVAGRLAEPVTCSPPQRKRQPRRT